MADQRLPDTEYGGADSMYGNVDRGAPLTPWLEAVAYRRSARLGDPTGSAVYSPQYGTGGVRAT